MDTKSGLVKNSVFGVFLEAYKHYKEISEAYNEKKWYRFTALLILTAVMIAAGLFVKPLLIAFFTKWFIGTWGLSLTAGKVAAAHAGTFVTAQVGKYMKYGVMRIKK
ncbi:hypothetical protein CWS43_25950 [Rahnella sp. AA]|uniref:hypothetical protein n=1 Tax=Rahnella sp. AA TaxID=2057180 RepID=UPI000C334FEB|nr:hypothetical protein [Rahnella sp. AA]PKE27570.1 hypothetical protein CWS43_25950 [Rahnella sp. AA]